MNDKPMDFIVLHTGQVTELLQMRKYYSNSRHQTSVSFEDRRDSTVGCGPRCPAEILS